MLPTICSTTNVLQAVETCRVVQKQLIVYRSAATFLSHLTPTYIAQVSTLMHGLRLLIGESLQEFPRRAKINRNKRDNLFWYDRCTGGVKSSFIWILFSLHQSGSEYRKFLHFFSSALCRQT